MKNAWILWILIVAVVVGVLISFNYQSTQKTVPLSDIFPEDDATEGVQYEFVDNNAQVTVDQPKGDVSVSQKTTVKQSPITVVSAPRHIPMAEAGLSNSTGFSNVAYSVQVLSVKDKKKAEKVVDALKKKGLDAFWQEKDLGEKGIIFRVYAGKFSQKSQAEIALSKVRIDFKDAFIFVPKK